MHHPFSNPVAEDKKKKDAEKEALEAALHSTTEIARRILSSDDGKKYQEKIRADLETITEKLLRICADDPVKDAYFMRACLNKIAMHYDLLKEIQKDSE